MKTSVSRWIFVWVLLLPHALAFESLRLSLWPDGTVPLVYNLGETPVYGDGSTPNQAADVAARLWNPYLGRIQLAGASGASGASAVGNKQNNVFFSRDVRGTDFGSSVLAVTLLYQRGGEKEVDILVNSSRTWNSYRGRLSIPVIDIRRVLAHEYGHLIGLGHPDEAGEIRDALMNSTAGDIETPEFDDQAGAFALYGVGVNTSKPIIEEDLSDRTFYDSGGFALTISVSYATPATYRWFHDGVEIPNEVESYLLRPLATKSDEGEYWVELTNIFGTTVSRRANVRQIPIPPPVLLAAPANAEVREGESIFLSATFEGIDLRYQWFKDGVALPNQTDSTCSIRGARLEDKGSYTVHATNKAGTTMAPPVTVTVKRRYLPWMPPRFDVAVQEGGRLELDLGNFSQEFTAIQWYKDGALIPGANSASYSKNGVTSADFGEYAAVVTNSSGSTATERVLVKAAPKAFDPGSVWLGYGRIGDTVFFAFGNPGRIERFDLTSRSWLTPLMIGRTITAFATGANALFVGSGRTVYRYNSSGQEEFFLFESDTVLESILPTNNWLIGSSRERVMAKAKIRVYPIGGGRAAFALDDVNLLPGSEAFQESDAMLYFTNSLSIRGSLFRVAVDAQGALTFPATEQGLGALGECGRALRSPGGDFVLIQIGRVLRRDGLVSAADIGSFDDLAFRSGSEAVILKDSTLRVLNSQWHSEKEITLSRRAARIEFDKGKVVAFSPAEVAGQRPLVEEVDLAGAADATPSAAPAKSGLESYYTDFIDLDPDGNVVLVAPMERQVLRWSPQFKAYIEGWGLRGMPQRSAVDANGRMYFLYANRRVTVLSPKDPYEREVFVATDRVTSMAGTLAGLYLTEKSGSEGEVSHSVDAHGDMVWRKPDAAPLMASGWNSSRDLVYSVFALGSSSVTSSLAKIGEDGRVDEVKTLSTTIDGYPLAPVAVHSSGDYVATGTGSVISIKTGTLAASMTGELSDAAWVGDTLFTLSRPYLKLLVQKRSGPGFPLMKSVELMGEPKRILALPDGRLLVVHILEGVVSFTILSQDLEVLFTGNKPPRRMATLANISSRASVGVGGDVAIAGFVVQGSGPQNLLIRAAGPKLKDQKVTRFLADPQIDIYNQKQQKVFSNDDWGGVKTGVDGLRETFKKVGAFDFDTDSRDSAIQVTLDPGVYTAIMSGVSSGQGIGLIEVYAVDPKSNSGRLVNISTRAKVASGDDVLIGGFVVDGAVPKRMLIRAAGPGLIKQGVSGVLPNPRLKIYSGATVIAENDDWDGSSAMTDLFDKVGAFRFDVGSREAAILVELPPGGYTVIIEGVNGATGVALVEVYEVPE